MTIRQQKIYRLFSSNYQRFAICAGHEIQINSPVGFDLVYGQEMTDQAEKNLSKGSS